MQYHFHNYGKVGTKMDIPRFRISGIETKKGLQNNKTYDILNMKIKH